MAARKIQGGVILLLLLVTSSGCGYRLAGGAIEAGQGETLAVPIFDNLTTDFRVEQRLTAAVRRELVQRTQYRVVPGASGDVVLDGVDMMSLSPKELQKMWGSEVSMVFQDPLG